MDHAKFLNDKSRVLNEILQSARSLNDNGFKNADRSLINSINLLRALIKDHDLKH